MEDNKLFYASKCNHPKGYRWVNGKHELICSKCYRKVAKFE